MSFDHLQDQIRAMKNPTVVGLDPKPEYVPPHILQACYEEFGANLAGAVHAGWRGTSLGIVTRTVERMVECFACRREDILAAIGPGISKCCFETHEDVPNAMTEALGASALQFIEILPTGKFHLDLKGLNAKRLEGAGVLAEHIAVSPDCTACMPEKYWSHRVTQGQRGSQAAMIALV